MNNNLIIFNKDDSKNAVSFPVSVNEARALSHYKNAHPTCEEEILKYFFIKDDPTPISTYKRYYTLTEDLKLTMDIPFFMKTKRLEEIRQKRDFFISKLDVPFMKALEEDDEIVKRHVVKLKRFLRDLPEDTRFMTLSDTNEIIKYDPFGNVFEVVILKQGDGYNSPPKVTIDGPKGDRFGFPAKGVAFIKGGKVTRIELTYYGCAYNHIPTVTIDPSENGETAVAICGHPQNVMISQQEIESNTRLYYS